MILSLFKAPPRKASTLQSQRDYSVAGRVLPLSVVENPRATRLTLRIQPGGKGLRVTIPPGLSAREVECFLSRHEGWIETRIAKMPDQPRVRPGIEIPIRGVPHLIVHEPAKRGTVRQEEGPDGPLLVVFGDRLHLGRRIADFLKREARKDMEALVAKHTQTVGRKAKAIRYKDTKSRWGSCSSDGTLSFSWRIAMAPRPIIDYLVAHEVAHLREMNHGPNFWKLCKELCPDTDRCKAWPKRNGGALQAIDFG